jgi:hypothetical protein
MYPLTELLDHKPASILIWFRGRLDIIEQERLDVPKAAEHRHTPQRDRHSTRRVLSCVLECGGAPPLSRRYWDLTRVWSDGRLMIKPVKALPAATSAKLQN